MTMNLKTELRKTLNKKNFNMETRNLKCGNKAINDRKA
jgi:hypothetical protein